MRDWLEILWEIRWVLAALVLVLSGIAGLHWWDHATCARWEVRMVHRGARYIPMGKIHVYQPAGDFPRNVCVERKK